MPLNSWDELPFIKPEELFMLEQFCKAEKLQMWHRYTEPEAAVVMTLNLSTLKRGRDPEVGPPILIPGMHYIDLGPRGIRYPGYMIARMMLFGIRGVPWQSIVSGLSQPENGTLPKGEVSGTDAGSTKSPAPQTVSALAQKTFQKQKNA